MRGGDNYVRFRRVGEGRGLQRSGQLDQRRRDLTPSIMAGDAGLTAMRHPPFYFFEAFTI